MVTTTIKKKFKPYRELIQNPDGSFTPKTNMNRPQTAAYDSIKRFILFLSGSQAGKTVSGVDWLKQEIDRTYDPDDPYNDYIIVTATYKLLKKKLEKEFLTVFRDIYDLGTYHQTDNLFTYYNGRIRIFLVSATNPEALESATAKAAWLDEAGQDQFKHGTWDAIMSRLSIATGKGEGRVLITTCYDDKTDIYTDGGWKNIGYLNDNDMVFAPNVNGTGNFEKPSRRTWEHYEGKMYHFVGGRIDLCVTPNHRILYKNSKHYFIKDAEHFSKLKHRSLTIPKLISPNIPNRDYFTLPSITKGHRWGSLVEPEIKIPMADWCAFMGWYLSEGCSKSSNGGVIKDSMYRVMISQKYGGKRDLIKNDLLKLPFKWTSEKSGFTTTNKQLWSYLIKLGNSHAKYIPRELMLIGKGNLQILLDRMILGDGSKTRNSFAYYTTSKQLALDFQEVCMLCGISTKCKERNNNTEIQGVKLKSNTFIYHIWGRRRKSGIIKQFTEIDYKGNIGCVGTSTGLVLVRRNGEECISGNTLYNFGWLKYELYDRWEREGKNERCADIDVFQAESIENPAFPPEEFDRLRSLMPAWKFDMRYRGVYTKPAGLIYDCFDTKSMIKPFPIPEDWVCFVGMDFGVVSTGCMWYAMNPENGMYYAYREYQKGHKSAAEHARELLDLSGNERILKIVGGAVAEDGWREAFQNAGWFVEKPTVKEVEVGINAVYAFHKKAKLLVFRNLEEYIKQKQSYSRKVDDDYEPTDVIQDKKRFHLCFVKGTKVQTINGLRNIQDIKVGDMVATRKGYYPVKYTMNRVADTMTVRFSNGKSLTGTPDHPVWVKNKGCIALQALRYGDIVKTLKDTDVPVSVVSVSPNKKSTVYNLTVDTVHEYFANGILVFNCDAERYILSEFNAFDVSSSETIEVRSYC